MSLQHNHLKHLHVEKKIRPLELSNIASTVASLPQSLCSSCPLWHHASQELGGQEGADHVSQTLLLTGFKDGLSRESELGEGRWTSSLTFVPVTVAIATMACIQATHSGLLGPHSRGATEPISQCPQTGVCNSWSMPLFTDLRTDSEGPPLRSAEAPAWLGSMPPPLRPEDRRSPPLAPGFFHFVVSLRGDIYCLQLLLGSLGILFEQILM